MTSVDKNLNSGNKRFSFSSQAYTTPGKFSVVRMEGQEAISSNFHFELILVSDDAGIDFESMLANPAKLSIFSSGGDNETPYLGVLSEFEQLQQVGQLVFYRAVLAPRLARTALYRTSDVHMGQKITDIIEQVLKDGKTISSDYETKLETVNYKYRDRDFVCQYQETDLEFLSRWMEKEGLYYYFDHSGPAEKLVILNDKIMAPDGQRSVTYRPVENMASGTAKDSVQSFVCRQKPLPKEVVLQGFNYLQANTVLSETVEVSDKGTGQVMLYGENFLDSNEGKQYAKVRADEIRCRGKVFHGEATAVGLRSGYFIRMGGHYRQEFNGEYLVTEISHWGSQSGVLLAGIDNPYGGNPGETDYHLSFQAIPKAVQFRPERSNIRPHVAGSISAIVDWDTDSNYAETDSKGRYKIRLPFARKKDAGKGSAWVRMATPYSGDGYGINFPLHKGSEVLLSFIDGDPDQPVIVNAVPNSQNPSVVNQDNRTKDVIRTAGGNYLELEDLKDKQRAHLYSPSAKSNWRIGAATTSAPGVAVWGDNRTGIHGSTDETVSLNAGKTLVLKVDAGTVNVANEPVQGSFNAHAKSHLLDIDNAKPVATPAPATGFYDVYAKHIRMYAEPDGNGNFAYQMVTGAPGPVADAEGLWDMGKLYSLQRFTNDYTLENTKGVVVAVAADKTTYTRGNSNSATFGDTSSVFHGDKKSLSRGADISHTYGMSSSMYFGMKNDVMSGFSNSVYAGGKHDLFAGEKISIGLSAEFGLSLSATASAVFGTKNTFHASTEVNAKLVLENTTKALASEQRLVAIEQDGTQLLNSAIRIASNVSTLNTAVLHLLA